MLNLKIVSAISRALTIPYLMAKGRFLAIKCDTVNPVMDKHVNIITMAKGSSKPRMSQSRLNAIPVKPARTINIKPSSPAAKARRNLLSLVIRYCPR
jgi:hypothetical protein